jgi:hypothetical protein
METSKEHKALFETKERKTDMTKYEMATEIAALSGERGHLFRGIINHQMGRPIGAVRESLARQRAIARVTRREIIRHCQPLALGK